MDKKVKRKNYIRYDRAVKERARSLRTQGMSYNELVSELQVSKSTIFEWVHDVVMGGEGKARIQRKIVEGSVKGMSIINTPEHLEFLRRWAKEHLAPKEKYTKEDLIGKIKNFYKENGRIPVKREFNMYQIYKQRFGSWNNAIRIAGFDPNPVLFAKKFISKDGHKCDSFTEKIIDDWLYEDRISHIRNAPYTETKMTADFKLGEHIFMEFFGLAGVQEKYDRLLFQKRKWCEEHNIILIEIYPPDMFPVNQIHLCINRTIDAWRENTDFHAQTATLSVERS